MSAGYQDAAGLNKVYSQIYQYNRDLRINKRMEALAQSFGCVRSHDAHKNSWQDEEILNKYLNIASNIQTGSGSSPSASGWKTSPGHYANVVNNNRVGCSAVVSGGGYCVFCYFART